MVTCVFTVLLMLTESGDKTHHIVADFLHLRTLETVEIDTVEQTYFEDLTFLQIDTGVAYVDSSGSYYAFPPRPFKPIRIALDNDGRVYRLFGLDSSEYNSLIYRYPASETILEARNLYDYGRFFLEIALFSRLDGKHYFVDGSAWFVELNRRLMLDEGTRFLSRKLEELEQRMEELSPTLNFDTLKYDRRTDSYIVDYYVWFDSTGDLRYVSLRIELDGACYVLKDEIIAKSLGAYESVRQAMFPPLEDPIH